MREIEVAVHDVRGSLTIISRQCLTLRRHGGTGIVGTLRLIEREVERAGEVVDRMVGEHASRADSTDVGAIVREVVEANSGLAAQRDRHVGMSVEEGLIVVGRPERLRVAIENLVQNALRHAPVFTAILVRAVRDGEGIVIEVADEGGGVPTRDRVRIFEVGYRGARPVGRGTGLGLMIARDVAREHHGALELMRTAVGATFRLRLPTAEMAE